MAQYSLAQQNAVSNGLMSASALDELIKLVGPILVDIILKWIAKPKTTVMLLADPNAAAANPVIDFVINMIQNFGQNILAGLATQLKGSTNIWEQMLGGILANYSPQIIQLLVQFLQTVEGQQLIADAMSKI
jgi:hypothetical protein